MRRLLVWILFLAATKAGEFGQTHGKRGLTDLGIGSGWEMGVKMARWTGDIGNAANALGNDHDSGGGAGSQGGLPVGKQEDISLVAEGQGGGIAILAANFTGSKVGNLSGGDQGGSLVGGQLGGIAIVGNQEGFFMVGHEGVTHGGITIVPENQGSKIAIVAGSQGGPAGGVNSGNQGTSLSKGLSGNPPGHQVGEITLIAGSQAGLSGGQGSGQKAGAGVQERVQPKVKLRIVAVPQPYSVHVPYPVPVPVPHKVPVSVPQPYKVEVPRVVPVPVPHLVVVPVPQIIVTDGGGAGAAVGSPGGQVSAATGGRSGKSGS